MDDNIPKTEAERHCDILGHVKAEELADPLPVTVAKGEAGTLDETNSYTVEEAVANRFGNTSTM